MMNRPGSKLWSPLILLAALVMLFSAGTAESAGTAAQTRILSAIIVGGTCDVNGIWYATRTDEGKLQIRWDTAASETSYAVTITMPDGEKLNDISTSGVYLYPEKDLPAGTYELRITAYAGGTCTGYGLMKFVLEDAEGGEPEEEQPQDEEPGKPSDDEPEDGKPEEGGEGKTPPGGKGGGSRPSGGGASGWGGGGKSGGKSQGSSVTPGKALTSAHARGSGVLLPYGTVALTIGDEPMESLLIGGERLELTCGGHLFTGVILDDTLILTSEDGANEWTVTQKALKTLHESGIRVIRMISGNAEITLNTDLEFSGIKYARERSQGYVSADFQLTRQEGSWAVSVGDNLYDLTELTSGGQNGDNV